LELLYPRRLGMANEIDTCGLKIKSNLLALDVLIMDNIYRYSIDLLNGKKLPMSTFEGKTLLIVNIASKCSFANQVAGLESLYKEYKKDSFEILAVPCDQFGHSEPLSGEPLLDSYNKYFTASFYISQKHHVLGPDAHPIFNYLKTHTRGIVQNRAIKWNFTKFLVNSKGELVARYAPRTKPESLKTAIESQLYDESRLVQLAKV